MAGVALSLFKTTFAKQANHFGTKTFLANNKYCFTAGYTSFFRFFVYIFPPPEIYQVAINYLGALMYK